MRIAGMDKRHPVVLALEPTTHKERHLKAKVQASQLQRIAELIPSQLTHPKLCRPQFRRTRTHIVEGKGKAAKAFKG